MQTKTCTTCHIEKEINEFHKHKLGKYGVDSKCKYCRVEYQQANKEQIAERSKQWRETNKEQLKQYHQTNKDKRNKKTSEWREKNHDYVVEQKKIFYINNREKILKHKQQYQVDSKERIAEYQKRYRQTSISKAIDKASKQNRRAAKLQNGGTHTGKQILELFQLQSGKCVYCKCKLLKTGKNKYHSDHIVPLSKGGSNDISNIQLLCPHCNLSKHDKPPEQFAMLFGMLI